jgi:hypothetical protein
VSDSYKIVSSFFSQFHLNNLILNMFFQFYLQLNSCYILFMLLCGFIVLERRFFLTFFYCLDNFAFSKRLFGSMLFFFKIYVH